MRWQTLVALFVASVLALPAMAYDYPLSPEAIRDAYFLGKEDAAKRDAFFAKYTQTFPLPESGPHVASIQFETPFAVVAEHTALARPNYLAPDAATEFSGKPGVFRMHVRIYLTESYGPLTNSNDGLNHLRSTDFWRDFTIRLVQGNEIRARTVRGHAIYKNGDLASGNVLAGANVDLDYDAAKIKSDVATVEVISPEGQKITATFDLASLR